MEDDFRAITITAADNKYADEEKKKQADILVEILLRLPVKALARFRTLCKYWNSLTHELSFIEAHHRGRVAHNSIIYLTLTKRDDVITYSKLDFDGKLIGDEFIIPGLPIDDHDYRFSNMVNGLTCLYGRKASYLLNPETRESIMLPTSNNIELAKYHSSMSLGFIAKTREYKLCRIYYDDDTPSHYVLWEILTLGTNEWRSIKHPHQQVDEMSVYTFVKFRPAFLHGVLYWIIRDPSMDGVDGILSFDLAGEYFGLFFSPPSPLKAFDIVELDEHLGFVRVSSEKKLMEVWKLEDYARIVRWTRAYTIDLLAVEVEVEPVYGDYVRVSNNGEIFFWSYKSNKSGVTCYDTRTRTFTRPISKQEVGHQLLMYTESLVSLKNWIK